MEIAKVEGMEMGVENLGHGSTLDVKKIKTKRIDGGEGRFRYADQIENLLPA